MLDSVDDAKACDNSEGSDMYSKDDEGDEARLSYAEECYDREEEQDSDCTEPDVDCWEKIAGVENRLCGTHDGCRHV